MVRYAVGGSAHQRLVPVPGHGHPPYLRRAAGEVFQQQRQVVPVLPIGWLEAPAVWSKPGAVITDESAERCVEG